MGAGSSKQPSWYPGEPAPSALAECPCAKTEVGARNSGGGTGVQGRKNVGPTATTVPSASGTGGNGHRHTAATPATTTAAGVRGGRDASCLPAVELADMEVCFCDEIVTQPFFQCHFLASKRSVLCQVHGLQWSCRSCQCRSPERWL